MRNFIAVIFILFIMVIAISVLKLNHNSLQFVEPDAETKWTEMPKIKSNQSSKEISNLIEGELFQFIGKTKNEVILALGEPIRKDLTPYGYVWWVYTDDNDEYLLIGMMEDSVETIYAAGVGVQSEPFKIGSTYDAISEQFPINDEVTYQTGLAFYTFKITADNQKQTPLMKLADNLFVQCYFDTFTEELSSIRIITGDLLLKQRFYEIEYRGTLPPDEVLSDEEWRNIERGMEQQIFELTNIHRTKHSLPSLSMDEQVGEVAYLHSKNMYDHNYFSHYGLDGTGLKERLAEKEVFYLSAGENIAAQHSDGPAAVEGWLNSKGHRDALLNENFSHLGVGVHRLYYTQNFLLKY